MPSSFNAGNSGFHLVLFLADNCDLADCQSEETCDRIRFIQQDFRHGQVLVLILQRLGRQPVVDLGLSARK